MSSKQLTILIPAFNEAAIIAQTIQQVYQSAKKVLDQFEIMVIDDGSSDSTYDVALSTANNLGHEVRVIRSPVNQGVGFAFHHGLMNAKYQQLSLIPGDNAYTQAGIETLFSQCGLSSLVISYRQNMNERTFIRYLLSKLATLSLRLISGKKIRDAHSLYLFPVAETRSLNINAPGYGYHIEVLSRLLKRIPTFTEVPVTLNPKPDASSGVMKPKTLITLSKVVLNLLQLRLRRKL